MAERITSRANPLMAHIRRLASSRSSRYEAGEYLGDGIKLLEEAVRWGAPLTAVVYTPGTVLPALPANVRLVEVPADVMRSVSPMESPQGALFLARIPDLTPPEALPGKRYLALEGVQDPGNVGTILRTADAFGADGLLLLPGCADLYNHKTVRSSMGAVFRLPVWSSTLEELIEETNRANALRAEKQKRAQEAREAARKAQEGQQRPQGGRPHFTPPFAGRPSDPPAPPPSEEDSGLPPEA